jgi:hypothetical protein
MSLVIGLPLRKAGCYYLHAELRALIAGCRGCLALEVLGDERAQYFAQIMAKLRERLAEEFGRGFEAKNIRRVV